MQKEEAKAKSKKDGDGEKKLQVEEDLCRELVAPRQVRADVVLVPRLTQQAERLERIL